jgi:hypothetical protein
MPASYKHTQIGWVTGGGLLGAVVLCTVLVLLLPFNWIALAVFVLMGILLPLFWTLTVEVGEETLRFHFGIGLIKRRVPLAEIEACTTVRNHWLFGWGIRLTPHGWLYNVSGLYAVEVRMKNGRRFRIGTDEPKALCEAVLEAISPRPEGG